MLPPERVPEGLDHIEYQKLYLRYSSIGWMRQSMAAMNKAVLNQPEHVAQEGQAKAAAMFDALEKALFLNEVGEEVQKSIDDLKDFALGKADKALDKFESVRKAKDGLKNVFTLVSQTVQETIDGSLEHGLLPVLGLPLDYIPEGKTAEEYLNLSVKYNQIGACEPARECLQLAVSLDKDSAAGRMASRHLKTQVPRYKVKHEAMIKYMSALRYILTRKEDKARDLLVELEVKQPKFELPMIALSSICLKNGDVKRAKSLLKTALELNPNLVKIWCNKGRLAIAEWQLAELDACIDKASLLDPDDASVRALKNMQQHINNAGLRV